MARFHPVLLPALVFVIFLAYSAHARDTPSTFKKMLMAAGANKARLTDQLERDRRASNFAPKPKFRTALRMKTLNNDMDGHVIEKRSHISSHAAQSKLQADAQMPLNMDKRYYLTSSRRKYGKYSSPKKATKPAKTRSRPKTLGSLGLLSDLLNQKLDKMVDEKHIKQESISNSVNNNKEETKEEEEEKGDFVAQFLAQVLGGSGVGAQTGSSSGDVPPAIPELEEEIFEEPEEEYHVSVKRFDPIMFLGKEYQEKHADKMVNHLLEKRNMRIAEEAEEEAEELVQPEEADHQNALHDRDRGHHAKQSNGDGFDSQLRRHEYHGRHFAAQQRRSGSGHHRSYAHGVSSLVSEDFIPRMHLSVKHKRSSSRKKRAPVKRSPMMLGVKKSIARFWFI